jgi:anti-anti-sigma regulatory factor
MLTIQDKDLAEIVCKFSGDLGISSIQETYQVLEKLDLSFSKCKCFITDVDSIDLSFFQMLLAFGMKLKDSGKQISFEFTLDEEYQRIFQRSGLEDAFDKLLAK